MTIKEKIQKYLDYKGVSPTAAERELNWGVGAFTKAKSITVDRAKEFLLFYKDLSAEWLMRDEGEMLREEKSDNVHFPNSNFAIFTIREIGDNTTFERSVAINMNQVKAIEDHATTCRIIMVDGKEYEILCGFSDFIKR